MKAFAAQMTTKAKNYAAFLTSDYAQVASTKAFTIRLIPKFGSNAMVVLKEFVGK